MKITRTSFSTNFIWPDLVIEVCRRNMDGVRYVSFFANNGEEDDTTASPVGNNPIKTLRRVKTFLESCVTSQKSFVFLAGDERLERFYSRLFKKNPEGDYVFSRKS